MRRGSSCRKDYYIISGDGMTGYKGTPASSQIIWLEKEVKRLEKYEQLVWFIANDYYELSYDKVRWQHNDWYKRCRKLIEEENEDNN